MRHSAVPGLHNGQCPRAPTKVLDQSSIGQAYIVPGGGWRGAFTSREKRQKAATRLENQSIAAAVDKATEEVHHATEQEFQHWHKLPNEKQPCTCKLPPYLTGKSTPCHGPRAITHVESIAVTETFLPVLLSKSSSCELVAYMFKVFCLEPICTYSITDANTSIRAAGHMGSCRINPCW